jgi:hypothetical protein
VAMQGHTDLDNGTGTASWVSTLEDARANKDTVHTKLRGGSQGNRGRGQGREHKLSAGPSLSAGEGSQTLMLMIASTPRRYCVQLCPSLRPCQPC